MSGENILARLETEVERLHTPSVARVVTAIWDVEYAVRARPTSTPLHLRHICVQTERAIGSCYYERSSTDKPFVSESDIGRDAVEDVWPSRPLRIAALDAVFGSVVSEPDELHRLEGTTSYMAEQRAEIVVAEVRAVAARLRRTRHKTRVHNVGVVGDFLQLLRQTKTFSLSATDFYSGVMDRRIHGTSVESGDLTLERVKEADIAVVTGMTLANDTLGQILNVAHEAGTAVILFAETGANFADYYLTLGATSVVAEPFPFYLSGAGHSIVRVHRKKGIS